MRHYSSSTARQLIMQGAPLEYPAIELIVSDAGVPLLAGSKRLESSAIKAHPFLGTILGNPISNLANMALEENHARVFLMKNLILKIKENCAFTLLCTSHDQSKTGALRKDSQGHATGASTDFILAYDHKDGTLSPLLDLVNSVSFLTFLKAIADELSRIMVTLGGEWDGASMTIGVEYDHIHIEWPWSTRLIPSMTAKMRLMEMPPRVNIGIFYNPQPAYGLPPTRCGLGDATLLLL